MDSLSRIVFQIVFQDVFQGIINGIINNTVGIADATYHIAATAAIFAGGAWAYFKFVKNRTFTKRLSLDVEGRIIHSAHGVWHEDAGGQLQDMPSLVVRCRATNIGLRQVGIQGDLTGLRLYFHGVQTGRASGSVGTGESLGSLRPPDSVLADMRICP